MPNPETSSVCQTGRSGTVRTSRWIGIRSTVTVPSSTMRCTTNPSTTGSSALDSARVTPRPTRLAAPRRLSGGDSSTSPADALRLPRPRRTLIMPPSAPGFNGWATTTAPNRSSETIAVAWSTSGAMIVSKPMLSSSVL